MAPCVEKKASPSTNTFMRPPARPRAEIAYSLSPKTPVAQRRPISWLNVKVDPAFATLTINVPPSRLTATLDDGHALRASFDDDVAAPPSALAPVALRSSLPWPHIVYFDGWSPQHYRIAA